MELEAQQSPSEKIWTTYKVPIITCGIAVFVLIIGLRIYFSQKKTPQFEFVSRSSESTSSARTKTDIKIEAAGAVVAPGVYTLKPDSRVQDVLLIAGGLSLQADRVWVAKNINLASKVSDGGKIYIPTSQEIESHTIPVQISTDIQNPIVNINQSSQAEIEALPGIGPVTAVKIISGRPYGAIEELLSKNIVGKSVFEKIKEQISVN